MAFPGRRFMNIFTLLLAMWNSAFLNSTVRYRESFLQQALYCTQICKKRKSHSTKMLNYMSICHTEHTPKKIVRAAPSVPDKGQQTEIRPLTAEGQAGCRSCCLFIGSSWL